MPIAFFSFDATAPIGALSYLHETLFRSMDTALWREVLKCQGPILNPVAVLILGSRLIFASSDNE